MPDRFETHNGALRMMTSVAVGCALLSTATIHAQSAVTANALSAVLPDAPKPASGSGRPEIVYDDDLTLAGTPKRLLTDEWGIIRAPGHTGKRDLRWLLPLAGATAAAIATDSHVMRTVVSTDASFNASNNTVSGALRDAFIGAPIILFGAGELLRQSQPRDTGLLAGEAMINAYVSSEAIKYITLRERPVIANQRGHFFSADSASDPSFVSGHSIVAWSSAAVLAGQYHKPWEQIGIYSAASAVSLTRVLAEQHFPSDVLLGSAAGWLIGRYVFQTHTGKGALHRVLGSNSTDKQLIKLP